MKDIKKTSVKKHAAAIHCSGELSLVERKLSNILLLNAFDDLLTKDTHTIPSRHLFAMLGWEDSNNIEGLKTTLKGLMATIIEFNLMGDGGEVWHAMTLLSSAVLSEGECRYSYAKDLAAKFYKPEIFAVINIGVQKQFKSNYALTLYENCVRFIKVGSTGWWDLVTFRKIMGANSETYDEFKRLSSFVIKKAINEINEVSDIRIKVEYKKENRKVVLLRFLISPCPLQSLVENFEDDIQPDNIYSELKKMELFKRLRAHGIGERLALSWMIEEPELASKAVDYTEAMDGKGLIKGKTAGYIRRLIESKAQLDQSVYEREKQQKNIERSEEISEQQKLEYRKKRLIEYKRKLYLESLRKITKEQMLEIKDQFLLSNEGRHVSQVLFDPDKGKFINSVTQLTFLPWLKKLITPNYKDEDFEKWLKEEV